MIEGPMAADLATFRLNAVRRDMLTCELWDPYWEDRASGWEACAKVC
jgi:hypothetical protein